MIQHSNENAILPAQNAWDRTDLILINGISAMILQYCCTLEEGFVLMRSLTKYSRSLFTNNFDSYHLALPSPPRFANLSKESKEFEISLLRMRLTAGNLRQGKRVDKYVKDGKYWEHFYTGELDKEGKLYGKGTQIGMRNGKFNYKWKGTYKNDKWIGYSK